jgi:formylglycine-generating enzyme required for sulfatase activity
LSILLTAACQSTPEEIEIKFKTPSRIVGMKPMVLIPKGSSQLGSEEGFEDEKPVRKISIPAFYMDETPITYADFKKYVAEGGNKSAYWKYDTYNQNSQPVTGLNWYHAIDFCNWRSAKEGLQSVYEKVEGYDVWNHPKWKRNPKANGYRLPTEAEFEYAARGGLSKKKYPWGNDFDDSFANYDNEQGVMVGDWCRLADVNEGKQNSFGLYNMSGNIWHWCDSWYGSYNSRDTLNPQGAKSGRSKILRGGSWGSISPKYLRVSARSYSSPSNYNFEMGFRCVRSILTDVDSVSKIQSISYDFYRKVGQIPPPEVFVWDFSSKEFTEKLTQFIADNYPNSIYFQLQIDEQPVLTPAEIVRDIMEVTEEYKVNPLFLTSIMISESGFGSCSFPRWYNNPMAYHWQNRLMPVGLPSYQDHPNKQNRKYKTLKDAYRAFCRGIRRPWYFKAAHKNLYAFHRVYVGYEAEEWMLTLSRVYRQVAELRFEPYFPEKECGKFVYTDWKY